MGRGAKPYKGCIKKRESVFYTQGEGGTPNDGLNWDPLEQRIFFRLRVYKRARGRGVGTPYDGLYGEAHAQRGIFFKLQVYKRAGGGGYSLRWPILGSSRKGDLFQASGIQKGRGRGVLPMMAYTERLIPKGGYFSSFMYTKGQGIQQQQQQ